jgi:hypothetical protein
LYEFFGDVDRSILSDGDCDSHAGEGFVHDVTAVIVLKLGFVHEGRFGLSNALRHGQVLVGQRESLMWRIAWSDEQEQSQTRSGSAYRIVLSPLEHTRLDILWTRLSQCHASLGDLVISNLPEVSNYPGHVAPQDL